jgi:hypothetical protein
MLNIKPIIQVEVFWVVIPSSVVMGYHRFGRPCCLHLQGENAGGKDLDVNLHRRENLTLREEHSRFNGV